MRLISVRVAFPVLVAAIAALSVATTAAAQKSWTGNAGTNSWHDGNNWNPVGVPGPRDDVTIGGTNTVVHSTGATLVKSIALTSGNTTLVLEGGTLSAVESFSVGSGTFNYLGGAVGAASADPLINGGDLFIGPAATATAQFLMRGSSSLDGQVHPDQTVWVQGTNLTATLTVAPGLENGGTIRLESVLSSAPSNLNIPLGEELINLPTGVILAAPGTGGATNINTGNLTNHGQIVVEEGTSITLSNGNQVFRHVNGTIEGDFRIAGASFAIESTVTEPSTIHVRGTSSTLLAHDSPATTIWVQGTASTATLNIAPGVENAGTIRLENITSTGPSNLSISQAKGEEFVNLPTGVIEANVGTGGSRGIFGGGDVTNHGIISVEEGAVLTFSSSNRTLHQAGGSISADGELQMAAGASTFLFTGGGLDGNVICSSTVSIDVRDTVTQPSTIHVRGTSCTLLANDSPAMTIWVQGTTSAATLNIAPGVQNAGTIRLENITSTAPSNLTILSGAGNEFVNLATGVIEANVGTGGSRGIFGSGDVTNHGLISVEEGAIVTFSSSNRTLHQAGGSISADGEFQMAAGASTFLFTGGGLDGNVICSSTVSIDVRDTVIEPSTIKVRGTFSTLVTQDSPATTIWVQGTSSTSTLNIAPGAQNAGTIRLENIISTAPSNLTILDDKGEEFVNLASGVIEANVGTGGSRGIFGSGDVTNHGLISVEEGAIVTFSSSNRTLHQAGGSISADGEFQMTAAASTFLFTGGGLDGNVICSGTVSIDVRDTVIEPSTILVRGTFSTLVTQDSPATTIWVQGSSSNATLNIASGAQNAGTIRLENISSTSGSNLSIPSGESLVNLETGLIEARLGTGGSRTIFGSGATLVNHGMIDPGYPSSLTIHGNYMQTATGRFITEFAGSSIGQFTRLTVNGTATLAGTIELTRINEYVPDIHTLHAVLNAGSRIGVFQVFSTCDDVSIDYTDTQAIVFFNVSDIVGDLTNSGSVGVPDLLILLASWGDCPAGDDECCPADLTGNGTVGVPDLLLLLANWG